MHQRVYIARYVWRAAGLINQYPFKISMTTEILKSKFSDESIRDAWSCLHVFRDNYRCENIDKLVFLAIISYFVRCTKQIKELFPTRIRILHLSHDCNYFQNLRLLFLRKEILDVFDLSTWFLSTRSKRSISKKYRSLAGWLPSISADRSFIYSRRPVSLVYPTIDIVTHAFRRRREAAEYRKMILKGSFTSK